MIEFKEFQLEINHPNIPRKLVRKYDKNITVGMMKQNLKDEFYLNGVIKIEFQLPTGLNLKDDKIIDKIYYPNLKVLIEEDQNPGQQQVLNQMKLQDIMEQIASRKKYIQVLSITNFQSLKLSDQFYGFKQSIFDYYFQNDPNRMEFAEINTKIDTKNIKFMKLNPFLNFTGENYPFSNQPFLQKALTQVFDIQWQSIYKLVIVFTDSIQCDIFKQIRDLYQRGFKLLFISFSDTNQQWLQSLTNAYIVKNAANINLQDKSFLKEIQGTVSETLTQTLEPKKETTYKIETESSIFQTQSIVKIILNNESTYNENELVIETMQYYIPKIQNRQNLDKILKNKSQVKVQLTQDGVKEIKYSKKIFNKGSLKEVYECFINNQNYVLKQPLKSDGFKNEEEVIQEIKNHLLAYEIFSQFYQLLYNKKEKINVGFGEIFILKNKLDRYFILEPKYKGEVIKFNSNGAFIRDEINHFNEIAQAFSVFSYIYSDSNYMVLDIQGYQEGVYLTLSDPAVQTFRNDFSKTDLGKPVCDQYLAQWENKKRIGFEYLRLLQIQ